MFYFREWACTYIANVYKYIYSGNVYKISVHEYHIICEMNENLSRKHFNAYSVCIFISVNKMEDAQLALIF